VEDAAGRVAAATGKTVARCFAATLASARSRPGAWHAADVAGLVVFLAGPQASWITGSTFRSTAAIVPTAP